MKRHSPATMTRNILAVSMAFSVLLQPVLPQEAIAASNVLSGDIRITVTPADLTRTLPLKGNQKIVDMSLHGVALSDAFRALGKKGGFNVLIDESVQGDISVDLHGVKIQDALETFRTYGKLAYSVRNGDTLLVASADSEKGKSFAKSVTQVIPLRYTNAKVLAQLLNQSLFAAQTAAGAGGAGGAAAGGAQQIMPVTADYNTNSLIVVGTSTDIQAVLEHVAVLDVPREMKTWRLSHAEATTVASLLASSLFNEGTPAIEVGEESGGGGAAGGGAAAGGGGAAAKPAKVRVRTEEISEGTGAGSTGGGGGGSGGGGAASSLTSGITLRSKVKKDDNAKISSEGAIILPDSRLNTITLLGTLEQIAMAEGLIQTFDRKTPQVVLEVSLVELSEGMDKQYNINTGWRNGRFAFGRNNSQVAGIPTLPTTAFSNAIGLPTAGMESIMQFTTRPIVNARNFNIQLNNLLNEQKAKRLSNPTIVVSHDNEAVISIVDEIIRSEEITINDGVVSVEAIIGEAGIIMNILPKIGADGSVNLRVRPTISSVNDDNPDDNITLLSKREILAQNVTLRDGESFVLGGLIQDTNTEAISKSPILSELPIIGALARSSTRNKNRTELIIVITPHVMDDENAVGRGSQQEALSPVHMPSGSNVENTLTPVSRSSIDIPGVLPPLQGVSVVTPFTTSGTNTGNPPREAAPALMMLDDINLSPEPAKQAPKKPAAEVKPATTIALPRSTDEVSEDAIKAIMERFKQ